MHQLRHQRACPLTTSSHRLRRGLPGHLILPTPHAFAPQRQYRASEPPGPLVLLQTSTNLTSTLGTPLTSLDLKTGNFEGNSETKPRDLTPNFPIRLRALYAQ